MGSVLVAGAAVPAAFGAKPPKGDKPVPPGQPFQALLKLIEALGVRIDALEAAASQPGLLWINPLALQVPPPGGTALATASIQQVGLSGGLVVTPTQIGTAVAQAGVQVPLGFAITGVRVCYVPGVSSFVSGIQLFQFAGPPAAPPLSLVLSDPLGAPGSSDPVCEDSATAVSVDPSAGGPAYVSFPLTFGAVEPLVIFGAGLHVSPVAAP
ncbi:MAG TPA: hypothetical protein VD793_04595 [Gemmatimonadales bacterium]|nr:hypothetical protein [Gemmatimonadales bacterium]